MDAVFEILRDQDCDLFQRVSVNKSFGAHFHSNIEIIYVLDGEIEVSVGSRQALLGAGSIAVSDSYDIHAYRTPEYSRIRVLIIPIELVGSFSRLSEGKTFATPFLIDADGDGSILHAMTQLKNLNPRSIVAKGYIYVILGTLAQRLTLVPRSADRNGIGPIRSILLYMEHHFREPLQIADLARHFGYNKDYLSRLMVSTLGFGFKQYLGILRARHAANLIRSTDDRLSDIGCACGFHTQRTFDRVFKAQYGMTPAQYKKRSISIPKNGR